MPFVVLLAVAATAISLYVTSVRYAAVRSTVEAPNGWRYDVLTHRDGVMLYTPGEAIANAYSVLPVMFALARRRGRPWKWAIVVRPHPFHGHEDLLREVFDTREAAIDRTYELELAIRSGTRLWADDAEWFR